MKYIKSSDFNSVIKENLLRDLLGVKDTISADNEILNQAENKAIMTLYSYLDTTYDLEWLFLKEDRDPFLIDIILNIMLYTLQKRTTKDIIPEMRQIAYKETITQLENLRDGKITPPNWSRKNKFYDEHSNALLFNSNIRSSNDLDY